MGAPELLALREEAESRAAEAYALGMLSRSRHSRREVERRLERRGYSAAATRRAVDRLLELGYLDDLRAAEGWLRRRVERHPEGRAALLAGLLRHGVPREIAERAVDAELPAGREAEAASSFLKALYATEDAWAALATEPERGRALRRLLARGFSRASSRAALPPRRDRASDDGGGAGEGEE